MGDVGRPAERIGVVVGLPQEAALLRRTLRNAAPAIACAGPGPARAAQGAAGLIAGGAQKLISFGFAGGLDPALRPGDIIVGAGVVASDGRMRETDDSLARRLCAALDGSACRWSAGLVAGVDQVVTSAAAKQALASQTRAVLVDMESHAVAGAGRPFAILRVVVDPAERTLPSAVLAALSPSGRIMIPALLGGLLRRPAELRDLRALASDNRRARDGLRRAALALGAAFGPV